MTPAHRLFIGTIGEGVFRSLDGGETFRRACDGMFVECHVRALAVHPRQPHTLYLGSEQGLFRSDATPDPMFTDRLELDLGDVEPSLAGPKRPQDRVALRENKSAFRRSLTAPSGGGPVARDFSR